MDRCLIAIKSTPFSEGLKNWLYAAGLVLEAGHSFCGGDVLAGFGW